jgi:hypothetical protein
VKTIPCLTITRATISPLTLLLLLSAVPTSVQAQSSETELDSGQDPAEASAENGQEVSVEIGNQAQPMTCRVSALMPIKYVPASIRAHGTINCSRKATSCTTHIYLQVWDFYYKSWVNVQGEDRWYYKCPAGNATQQLYSKYYKCIRPYSNNRWRSVVYSTIEYQEDVAHFQITSSPVHHDC